MLPRVLDMNQVPWHPGGGDQPSCGKKGLVWVHSDIFHLIQARSLLKSKRCSSGKDRTLNDVYGNYGRKDQGECTQMWTVTLKKWQRMKTHKNWRIPETSSLTKWTNKPTLRSRLHHFLFTALKRCTKSLFINMHVNQYVMNSWLFGRFAVPRHLLCPDDHFPIFLPYFKKQNTHISLMYIKSALLQMIFYPVARSTKGVLTIKTLHLSLYSFLNLCFHFHWIFSSYCELWVFVVMIFMTFSFSQSVQVFTLTQVIYGLLW